MGNARERRGDLLVVHLERVAEEHERHGRHLHGRTSSACCATARHQRRLAIIARCSRRPREFYHCAVSHEGLGGGDNVVVNQKGVLKTLSHFEIGGGGVQEHAAVGARVELWAASGRCEQHDVLWLQRARARAGVMWPGEAKEHRC